ncbi:BRCT domain-containing protein [Anopheles sinensis]|uniref:BRCT domain-containing protein n=1 Tax=Anopheles sinensis TaxID=74873 RepID=A0A084W5V7_ANOSI|nr:BRCT domain-containing protein [Anopheles sinensis]
MLHWPIAKTPNTKRRARVFGRPNSDPNIQDGVETTDNIRFDPTRSYHTIRFEGRLQSNISMFRPITPVLKTVHQCSTQPPRPHRWLIPGVISCRAKVDVYESIKMFRRNPISGRRAKAPVGVRLGKGNTFQTGNEASKPNPAQIPVSGHEYSDIVRIVEPVFNPLLLHAKKLTEIFGPTFRFETL